MDVPGGTIDGDAIAQMIARFHEVYEQRAGNRFEALPVQGVTYRVQAVVAIDKVSYASVGARNGTPLAPSRTIKLLDLDGTAYDAAEHERAALHAGDVIEGPAVIREELSTTRVGVGQTATIGSYGEIVIERGSN